MIEMSLKKFLKKCPELKNFLPRNMDLKDPNYIVRIDLEKNALEFGYKNDNWEIVDDEDN